MTSSPQEDQEKKGPDALADDLEREADRLEQRSEDLGGDIKDTRQDWESKQADSGVPGAVSEDDDADDSSGSPAAGEGSPA